MKGLQKPTTYGGGRVKDEGRGSAAAAAAIFVLKLRVDNPTKALTDFLGTEVPSVLVSGQAA